VVGHQEGGQVIIHPAGGTKRVAVSTLRDLAQRAGLELLVWGCGSAEYGSGGVAESFREKPLIAALEKALTRPGDLSLGTLLGAIGREAQVTFVFDAVDAIASDRMTARVRDRNGREGVVDLPSPRARQQNGASSSSVTLPDLDRYRERSGSEDVAAFVGSMIGVGFIGSLLGLFVSLMSIADVWGKQLLARELLAFWLMGPMLCACMFTIPVALSWIGAAIFGSSSVAVIPAAALWATGVYWAFRVVAHIGRPPT
jgi:hypothetical protein